MNRIEFMKQLERLLSSIPETERQEALQYYNDYFDDAGAENEKEVLEALGNPAKVAENIKRDLYGGESGVSAMLKHPMVKYQEDSDKRKSAEGEKNQEGNFLNRMGGWFGSLPIWGQVIAVVGIILLAPVLFGVLTGALGALVGAIAGWFSLILGFGVSAIVLIVVLFVLVIVGIMCMAELPWVGVALAGAGLMCGGLGILFLMLTVAMAGIVTPAVAKGIAGLCRRIFGKKEAAV